MKGSKQLFFKVENLTCGQNYQKRTTLLNNGLFRRNFQQFELVILF